MLCYSFANLSVGLVPDSHNSVPQNSFGNSNLAHHIYANQQPNYIDSSVRLVYTVALRWL